MIEPPVATANPPMRQDVGMDEDEVRALAAALPGVHVQVADEASGAPELAWGDSFFFYDPDDEEADRRFPFATIVTKDYTDFDTASDLDRPGVFRVNLRVGRERLASVVDAAGTVDHTALDTLLPHPIYATQGWVSVLNPGERTSSVVAELLRAAHTDAVARHERRGERPS